jgi:hypothetical protein
VIRQKHWKRQSFITLGPLRRIERQYSRKSIYVVDDDDVGIVADSAAGVDKNALGSLLDGLTCH